MNVHQITPQSELGFTDSHRSARLLDLCDLLTRSQGGSVQLRWPSQADLLATSATRDLNYAGAPLRNCLSLGQQLRTHSAIARAGATFLTLPVLQESALPSIDRAKKASWVGSAADVAPTLALTNSAPLRLSAYLTASKQLIRTAPALAAGFLEAQLLSAIGAALDDSAINGTGTNEPFGLLTDAAVAEYEIAGAALAPGDLIGMEQAIATVHGEGGDPLTWLASADTRALLRGTSRIQTGTTPLWPDELNAGPFGHRGVSSPWAPAGALIFGNFSDLLILQSSAIEVILNPYSLDATGFVRLTVSGFFDIVALNPESSFVRATPAP